MLKNKSQQEKMREVVFLNGKFISPDEAKISAFEPGLLYGWGLFETMRAYRNKIVYLDAHLKRLKHSCALINIKFPYSLDKLKKIIKKTVKINGFSDAYVRLTLWKSDSGTDVLIFTRRYHPYSPRKYRKGFCAGISQFRQNENSFFSRLKTTSYMLCRLSYLEAKKRGFDEAIILNNRGYIAEGSRSNIFFIKDKKVFTPALECGCLEGITRKAVFDLARKSRIKIHQGNFTLEDLSAAQGAFLTNSLIGIMPLTYLEKHPIAKGLVGKITRFFQRRYNLLLKSGT